MPRVKVLCHRKFVQLLNQLVARGQEGFLGGRIVVLPPCSRTTLSNRQNTPGEAPYREQVLVVSSCQGQTRKATHEVTILLPLNNRLASLLAAYCCNHTRAVPISLCYGCIGGLRLSLLVQHRHLSCGRFPWWQADKNGRERQVGKDPPTHKKQIESRTVTRPCICTYSTDRGGTNAQSQRWYSCQFSYIQRSHTTIKARVEPETPQVSLSRG